ncbi:phage major capsid protein [Actinacidiphila oryziradicis]|uniref:Phage major capsid protein n=1 Tax=Actinacidiphila oryziradicis TaxID=2571141 RepID=A0A4U0T8J8_9ACTN|nr:phage major capsid protein [Actinacidiphila oryziradicis]TKA10805.1 phage major capsid protein [Actinacidiphila oryziradicis]
MTKTEMITALRAKRAESNAQATRLINTAKSEHRSLTAVEGTRFDALETELREFTERIEELSEQVLADAAAAPMQARFSPNQNGNSNMDQTRNAMPGKAYEPRATVSKSEEIYRKYGKYSYFQDLYRADNKHDADAADRLQRNNTIVQERDKAAGEVRALTTTDGSAGEMVPPLWLTNEFVRLARPGRVTVDLTDIQPLPPGTDSINIPKVNSGTSVAQQLVQNSAISQTDMTTSSIASPVITLAGGQILAMQLVEMSPITGGMDRMILDDLSSSYAVQLNSAILSGPGTGGALTGILSLAGTQQIAYTQTTPTLTGIGGFFSILASAISAIHSTRFKAPDAIVMHPRRWAYLCAQADSTGRPLVLPNGNGAFNSMGLSTEVTAEGSVGTLLGLPVYADASIPVNLGAGTNEDRVILIRREELLTWESNIRCQAYEQTYANNLSLYVRLYNYVSFQAGRYPAGIAVISGIGLKTPGW